MLVAPSLGLPVEQPADASAETGSPKRPPNLRDPRPVWLSVGEAVPLPAGLRGSGSPQPPSGPGGQRRGPRPSWTACSGRWRPNRRPTS